MYAFIENNKSIHGCGQCRCLNDDVVNIEITEEQYNNIQEYGNNYYIYDNGEIVLNPNYEDEQTAKRKVDFENQFLLTSKGNYRLQPKGYANAQQSIDTVNAIVMAMNGLTEQIAQMIIFYETPDFSKEEECTEEWLIQHQHHPQVMTKEEWTNFYIEFTTLYAQKQYKLERI